MKFMLKHILALIFIIPAGLYPMEGQQDNAKKRKINTDQVNTLGLLMNFLDKNNPEPEQKKQKIDDEEFHDYGINLPSEPLFGETSVLDPVPEQLVEEEEPDYNLFIEKNGKKFICTFENCKKEFTNRRNCKEHIRIKHFNKKYICEKCYKEFFSHKYYHSHKCTGKPAKIIEKNFICNECARSFVKRKSLVDHAFKKHGKINCTFADCNQSFTKRSDYTQHIKRDHLQLTIECTICNVLFKTEKKLQTHIEKFHTEEKHEESNILSSPKEIVLDYNQFVKKNEGKFICTYENCNKEFKTRSGCREHIEAKHFKKTETCGKCDKDFTSHSGYKKHIKNCTGKPVKKFTCNQCGKSYESDKAVKHHAFKDHGKIVCCDKAFTERSEYARHIKHDHLGFTIECSFCQKLFQHNSNLYRHMRDFHPGEKLD